VGHDVQSKFWEDFRGLLDVASGAGDGRTQSSPAGRGGPHSSSPVFASWSPNRGAGPFAGFPPRDFSQFPRPQHLRQHPPIASLVITVSRWGMHVRSRFWEDWSPSRRESQLRPEGTQRGGAEQTGDVAGQSRSSSSVHTGGAQASGHKDFQISRWIVFSWSNLFFSWSKCTNVASQPVRTFPERSSGARDERDGRRAAIFFRVWRCDGTRERARGRGDAGHD